MHTFSSLRIADEGIEEQLAGFDVDPEVAAERKAKAKAAVAEAKAARKAAAAAEREGADGDKLAEAVEEEEEEEVEGAVGALAILQALRLAAPLPEAALSAAGSDADAEDDGDEDSKGMPTVLQLRQHLRLTAWRLTNNVTVTRESLRRHATFPCEALAFVLMMSHLAVHFSILTYLPSPFSSMHVAPTPAACGRAFVRCYARCLFDESAAAAIAPAATAAAAAAMAMAPEVSALLPGGQFDSEGDMLAAGDAALAREGGATGNSDVAERIKIVLARYRGNAADVGAAAAAGGAGAPSASALAVVDEAAAAE